MLYDFTTTKGVFKADNIEWIGGSCFRPLTKCLKKLATFRGSQGITSGNDVQEWSTEVNHL